MSLEKRDLPAGWQWVKIGEVCEVISGQSPPGETYQSEPRGLPFFQGKADFGLLHPVARVWCIAPIKIAKPSDILISVRAPVGPTNVADVECCIGRGLAAIRCREKIDRNFLLCCLKLFENKIAKQGSGSTFDAINRDSLIEFPIPLPPLPEQKRIAAILTDQLAAVERAREASEARLEAARALPAAYLREVFESESAAKWPLKRLVDICLSNGQYGTSVKSNHLQKGLPILGMVNIYDGRIRWEKISYVELEKKEQEKFLLKKGDLLFNRTNSAELVGKTAIFDSDKLAVFASYLIRFRIDPKKTDPRFVAAYINSKRGRKFIERYMTRAIGQVNISASTMHEMPIPIPDLSIQEQIMDEFENRRIIVDELRAKLSDEYNTIASLPASLLRQAFTGNL